MKDTVRLGFVVGGVPIFALQPKTQRKSIDHNSLTICSTMKLAIFASLIAGAAAFAPAAQTVNSVTALNAKAPDWKASSPYKDEIGAMAPVRSA